MVATTTMLYRHTIWSQARHIRNMDTSMSTAHQIEAINPQDVENALAQALPDAMLQAIVDTFQALADPTRSRILYALMQQPLCVRDLAIVVGVSESAVSHQLRLLRDRRVVKSRRDGNIMYYSVDDTHVAGLFREAAYHVDHVQRGLPDHP